MHRRVAVSQRESEVLVLVLQNVVVNDPHLSAGSADWITHSTAASVSHFKDDIRNRVSNVTITIVAKVKL